MREEKQRGGSGQYDGEFLLREKDSKRRDGGGLGGLVDREEGDQQGLLGTETEDDCFWG